MAQKTAEIDITSLFGEPEDNSEEVWDTGFKVVGVTLAAILDPKNEETGYFVNEVYKQIIDSEGNLAGYLRGNPVQFIYDTEGNKTNYFLNNSRILRISGKK